MNAKTALLLLALYLVSRKARAVTHFTVAQLRTVALMAGFTGQAADIAAAVAMAESGGNPDAEGDLTLGVSRGLWQINLKAHPDFDPVRLFDPNYNAQAAFLVSSRGTNWKPWTAFNNGSYKKYLPAGSNA